MLIWRRVPMLNRTCASPRWVAVEELGLAIAMICGVALAPPSVPRASAEPIAIDVQVEDDPGIGFNDPVLGPQRLAAVRAAADRWGSFFVSSFPGETVPVVVKMVPSLVNDLGALTQVTATTESTAIGDITVQWSIMEHTSGTDAYAGVDGLIQFSEAVDFYLGTDGQPGDRLDLMTLALHEMGHVFGFISNLGADGTYNGGAQFGAIPNVYDLFLENSAGVSLLALSPQERVAVITSGDGLFWGGPAGVAGNGGVRPNMSAPTQYLEGTSVVHISETFFPGDPLMDAALYPGDVIRTLTPVERGMFYDMGWTVPEPGAPGLDAIAVLGILGLHRSRHRKQLPLGRI
jgi:hypothetical protein